jgi:hypothetical protein
MTLPILCSEERPSLRSSPVQKPNHLPTTSSTCLRLAGSLPKRNDPPLPPSPPPIPKPTHIDPQHPTSSRTTESFRSEPLILQLIILELDGTRRAITLMLQLVRARRGYEGGSLGLASPRRRGNWQRVGHQRRSEGREEAETRARRCRSRQMESSRSALNARPASYAITI